MLSRYWLCCLWCVLCVCFGPSFIFYITCIHFLPTNRIKNSFSLFLSHFFFFLLFNNLLFHLSYLYLPAVPPFTIWMYVLIHQE